MAGNLLRLHESAQRAICRIAFLGLGLFPLAVCLLLSIAGLLPGHAQRQAAGWEKRFAALFGLEVNIDSAACLAPFHYQLDEIQFLHPETRHCLGTVDRLEMRWNGDRWLIDLRELHLPLEQISSGCRMLHDWYICRPSPERRRASLRVDKIVVERNSQTCELANLEAELFPNSEKWALKATFSNGNKGQEYPERLTNQLLVFRHHDPANVSTEIQLRVEDPLPFWLAEAGLQSTEASSEMGSLVHALGDSRFSGVVDVRLRASGASVYLTNSRMREVEMGHVGLRGFPLVSGRGDLIINQAILDSKGLRCAEGGLQVGPGRVDHEFLRSLANHLQIQLNQHDASEFIGYDQLLVRFRIQPDSLQFVGGTEDGGLLLDSHGVLARRSDTTVIPISDLIYALASAPKSSGLVRSALVWLPLGESQRREAAQLLRISRN